MTVRWHFSVKEATAQKELLSEEKNAKRKPLKFSQDMKTFDDNSRRIEYLSRTCRKREWTEIYTEKLKLQMREFTISHQAQSKIGNVFDFLISHLSKLDFGFHFCAN